MTENNVNPTLVHKGAGMNLECVFMLSRGPEHPAASLLLLRDTALGFFVHWWPGPLLFQKQVLC